MTDDVPTDIILAVVGVPRDPYRHIGKAVSAEQTVYILHSHRCMEKVQKKGRPLSECLYSRALDNGIDVSQWVEDVPLVLRVNDGHLWPDLDARPSMGDD